jgi:hypothetical protein
MSGTTSSARWGASARILLRGDAGAGFEGNRSLPTRGHLLLPRTASERVRESRDSGHAGESLRPRTTAVELSALADTEARALGVRSVSLRTSSLWPAGQDAAGARRGGDGGCVALESRNFGIVCSLPASTRRKERQDFGATRLHAPLASDPSRTLPRSGAASRQMPDSES